MKELGSVGVRAGLVLVIDPILLFSTNEWDEMGKRLQERAYGHTGEIPHQEIADEVLRTLAAKLDRPQIEDLGFVGQTGSGCYTVAREANGILIQGA